MMSLQYTEVLVEAEVEEDSNSYDADPGCIQCTTGKKPRRCRVTRDIQRLLAKKTGRGGKPLERGPAACFSCKRRRIRCTWPGDDQSGTGPTAGSSSDDDDAEVSEQLVRAD